MSVLDGGSTPVGKKPPNIGGKVPRLRAKPVNNGNFGAVGR